VLRWLELSCGFQVAGRSGVPPPRWFARGCGTYRADRRRWERFAQYPVGTLGLLSAAHRSLAPW